MVNDPTEEMLTWPPGLRRNEDHQWYGTLARYNGVILLVIAIVLIVGAVITWVDRRDTDNTFTNLSAVVSALAADARGTKEILTRVERSVDTLSQQNARWVSLERELTQLRERVDQAHELLLKLQLRVQRLEDAAASAARPRVP